MEPELTSMGRLCDEKSEYQGCGSGSGAFLTPGSGMGKKSGSGMNIPDNFSESLETVFRAKNT
jgi:hypothetical protein